MAPTPALLERASSFCKLQTLVTNMFGRFWNNIGNLIIICCSYHVMYGLFLFFLAFFSCRVSVLDCCIGQSPGNESWSVSRRRGGQIHAMLFKRRLSSAGGSGLAWHVGEESATWWWEAIHVVVGGRVLASELAARAVKVARARAADHLAMRAAVTAWRKGFGALAGSGFGELAGEPCCFFAPTAFAATVLTRSFH